MSELCRVAGAASQDVISNSSNWSLWISVVAIATSTSNEEQRDRMCDALTEGYRSVSDIWEGIYGGLAAFLGLRVRAPRTLHQFADALSSLSEGDSLRQHVLRESIRFDLPSGPGGELQEWTLYGTTIEALAIQFFEPDPGLRRRLTDGSSTDLLG